MKRFDETTKKSEVYQAIVSAQIYVDEDGKKDIEIFNYVHDDFEGVGIFEDIEYQLLEEIDLAENEQYFFVAQVKSWFDTYHDYFAGPQGDVESEVKELNSIEDYINIERERIGTEQRGERV